ncbi:MAG: hypothetical protein JETT_2272 [Candidatus Jettenia ecosi]|uniref:Uncharacterized protein n=1 Tax=Candidatus Jettenia ecosi TaxID=2494326 RepID=A0A533Q9V7_9BACT|nr:MAG: hypothetical protein JETT_2272 [Candidatus Jettenia ecosi]
MSLKSHRAIRMSTISAVIPKDQGISKVKGMVDTVVKDVKTMRKTMP